MIAHERRIDKAKKHNCISLSLRCLPTHINTANTPTHTQTTFFAGVQAWSDENGRESTFCSHSHTFDAGRDRNKRISQSLFLPFCLLSSLFHLFFVLFSFLPLSAGIGFIVVMYCFSPQSSSYKFPVSYCSVDVYVRQAAWGLGKGGKKGVCKKE